MVSAGPKSSVIATDSAPPAEGEVVEELGAEEAAAGEVAAEEVVAEGIAVFWVGCPELEAVPVVLEVQPDAPANASRSSAPQKASTIIRDL